MRSSGGMMHILKNVLLMLSTKEKKKRLQIVFSKMIKVTEEDLYLVYINKNIVVVTCFIKITLYEQL